MTKIRRAVRSHNSFSFIPKAFLASFISLICLDFHTLTLISRKVYICHGFITQGKNLISEALLANKWDAIFFLGHLTFKQIIFVILRGGTLGGTYQIILICTLVPLLSRDGCLFVSWSSATALCSEILLPTSFLVAGIGADDDDISGGIVLLFTS